MLVLVALIVVLLLDQGLKLLVIHRLQHESISLGSIGRVRRVPKQIWMIRLQRHLSLRSIWILWIVGACAVAVLHNFVASSDWFCGLLLGGSLSHALETTWRGHICDYVCLRFWPAFNLADIAITAGAIGVVTNLIQMTVNSSVQALL